MFKVGVEVLSKAGFKTVDAMCGVSAVSDLAQSIGWASANLDQLYKPDVRTELRELKAAAGVSITPETFLERALGYLLDGLALKLQTTRPSPTRERRRLRGRS